MTGKFLGKIESVDFGQYPDRPFLMGIQLTFKFDNGGVGCGAKYTINISDNCRWEKEERYEAIDKMIKHIDKLLTDAKVNYVSQLKNKPVEIEIEDNTFRGFRILTEVL